MVFRPYAHLLPSSCTSERLRASSGLSPTFTQDRHSSPPFGSHPRAQSLSEHGAQMDSLVRVTRRAKQCFLRTPAFSFFIEIIFTFRSPYLFAIGHPPIFSLGSPQPPTFSLHYQTGLLRENGPHRPTGNSPSMSCRHKQLRTARPKYNSHAITIWASSVSLAATREILVNFFSFP